MLQIVKRWRTPHTYISGAFLWGDSKSGSVIQDLSGSWCIKRTSESMTRVDLPVPLMHHDPDRSWITDPDLDHPKGTQPSITSSRALAMQYFGLILVTCLFLFRSALAKEKAYSIGFRSGE